MTFQDKIQQLQQDGDFLTLTRDHEWSFPQAFDFQVTHQATNTISQVSVLDTGIIVFEPVERKTTKDIVLSCAVHGNETAPIEICAELVSQLIKGELYLSERVLFLFGNPAAMNIAERFVEENLNRLFSGAHSEGDVQNKERVRAKALEDAVRNFFEQGNSFEQGSIEGEETPRERSHYDLHTAIRGSKMTNSQFTHLDMVSRGKNRNLHFYKLVMSPPFYCHTHQRPRLAIFLLITLVPMPLLSS